jgi:Tfp pilus assembly protein PilF
MGAAQETEASGARWRRVAGLSVLVVLVLAVYSPALRNGFVYDDDVLIVRAATPESAGDVLRVFGERHWKGLPYYRPVPRATMVLQKLVHGNAPAPYHLFNMLLMAATALAAWDLLRRPVFRIPETAALVGAALFALHPVASETVYPIASGRETSIPGLLAILAVSAFLRPGTGWRALSFVALALALLSKEQMVVLPLLFLLADLLGLAPAPAGRDPRRLLARHLPSIVILAAYLAERWRLFAGAGEHELAILRDPLAPLLSLVYALQSIIDPRFDLVYEPRVQAWFAVGDLVAVVAVVAALAAWTWQLWPAVRDRARFWIGWILLALLPTANLLHQEARFAERYAFLSMLGLIGWALTLVAASWSSVVLRRAAAVASLALLVAFSWVTVHRARFYADELAFLEQWLRSDPGSAKAHHALGQYHYKQQDFAAAARHFQLALENEPDYAAAHSNLGSMLAMQGRLDEAARHFEEAIRIQPRFAFAYNNLARVTVSRGDLQRAAALYEQSIEIDPTDATVRFTLGDLYLQTGRLEQARPHLEQAVRLDPYDARAHFSLGNLYLRESDATRAEFHFERAVLLDPQHAAAHNNLAIQLARRGEAERARVHFERALEIDPGYVQAHVNYGNLLLGQGRVDEGLARLRRALELDPRSQAARESLERAGETP